MDAREEHAVAKAWAAYAALPTWQYPPEDPETRKSLDAMYLALTTMQQDPVPGDLDSALNGIGALIPGISKEASADYIGPMQEAWAVWEKLMLTPVFELEFSVSPTGMFIVRVPDDDTISIDTDLFLKLVEAVNTKTSDNRRLTENAAKSLAYAANYEALRDAAVTAQAEAVLAYNKVDAERDVRIAEVKRLTRENIYLKQRVDELENPQ